jgi:chromosome segregation ATPase
MVYDPRKAHEYYERTKQLKGREPKGPDHPERTESSRPPGHSAPQSRPSLNSDVINSAKARVARLKTNVSKLQGALSDAQAALSKKRQEAVKTEKDNSDGKSTESEKQASKKYRDKNQAKLAAKDKAESKSKSSSSEPSSTSPSSMSVEDLEARVTRIKSALADAKRQLSNASQQLGQLAHSAITSEPTINDQFARFRSAERTS